LETEVFVGGVLVVVVVRDRKGDQGNVVTALEKTSTSIEGEAERTSPLPTPSLLSSVPPTISGMISRPVFV